MTRLDWLVMATLCLGLLVIGAWARRYVRSVADFVVADRKMRRYLGLSTGSAEGIGLISIAFLAEQGFTGGLGYVWMTLLNAVIVIPIFGILGFGIRRFRATRVQTIPQYLEMRYSRGVRISVGLVMFIGGVLNMAIFPIISSRFLTVFLHLPPQFTLGGHPFDTHWIIAVAMIFISLVTALTGGMVTVIITDYVQSIILAGATFVITALIVWHVPVSEAYRVMETQIGPSAFNPFLEGAYGPSWVIFFVLSGVFGALSFPPSAAKTCSADSTDTVRKMALISGLFTNGRTLMFLVWGVAALTVMGAAGGQVGAAPGDYARYATAEYVSTLAPAGIAGFCAAGLLFAYVTTDNSYYLAWSAILVNDVIAPLRKRPLTNAQHLRLLRLSIVGVAGFLLLWSAFYDPQESILSYLYLTGAIFTAAGVLTFFGLYWKRANVLGAYLVAAVCLLVPVADLVVKQLAAGSGWQYPLKAHQSGLLAILLAVAAIVACGLASRRGVARWHDFGEEVRQEDAARRGP